MTGKEPDEDSFVLRCSDRGLLAYPERDALFPLYKEIRSEDVRYLFSMDGEDYFLSMDEKAAFPSGGEYMSMRQIRRNPDISRHLSFISWTAWQLYRWYSDNRFCGRCGGRTELSSEERAICCPHCGRTIYPRIIPAVIAGVTDGNRILLTKYAGHGIPFYALIAGFTEIGETLEETVAREVMEEVGLKVRNIRYYKSQPWGIVDDLLAGFFCEVDGSRDIRMDEKELKEALWVEREEVELQPDDFSLTNEMMRMFKENRL